MTGGKADKLLSANIVMSTQKIKETPRSNTSNNKKV